MHSTRIRALHEIHIPAKVRQGLVGILLAAFVSGCQKAPAEHGEATGSVQVAAVDTVRKHLRDGQSGRFRNLKTFNHQGVAVVCGEVDATNGLGSTSGFMPFIYYGDTKQYLIQHPVFPREFDTYRVTCVDALGRDAFTRPR